MHLEIFPMRGARFAIPPYDPMLDPVKSGAYEPYVLDAFTEAVRPGMTVADIGANVGIFAVLAAQRGARVVAVDPSPVNCKIVSLNAMLNSVRSKIAIYPAAISDRMEMATFPRIAGSNKIVRPHDIDFASADGIDVCLALPLDTVLPEGADIVKIDVEGREYACLAGSKALDRKPVVFTEYSPDFIRNGSGVEGAAYLRLFFDRGYAATILHRDMTRENCGQDVERMHARWREYTSRNVTHLDLMLRTH